MVVIVDDRADVWNNSPNVIQVHPYRYFSHTGDINAPNGLTKKNGLLKYFPSLFDNSSYLTDQKPCEDNDDSLLRVERELELLHAAFYALHDWQVSGTEPVQEMRQLIEDLYKNGPPDTRTLLPYVRSISSGNVIVKTLGKSDE